MAHRTAPAPNTAELPGSEPPDVATMRVSARHALTEDPQPDELDTLRLTLRGHIEVLLPEVEALARREPKDSIPRHCALACVGEGRAKLRMGDGAPYIHVRVAVVEKLARVTNALCDHYENLGGTS